MISAVLLAAGESRRMGDFKQLLTLGGKTFVERCVDSLLASRADEVIVVTGHRAEDVRRALAGRAVRFAHNPDYRAGMSTSVVRAVEALSASARAMMVALADQPLVGADIFNRVIEAYEETRPLVVIPTFQGRNGHPVILDLGLREEILAIGPDEGLQKVVRAHADRTVRVEVSGPEVVTDFDLPEDYRRALERS